MLRLMLPAEIERDWGWLGAVLAPAIAHDDKRQDGDVFRDLLAGDMAMFRVVSPDANGLAVVEIDGPTFWIIYIAGRVAGQPHRWRDRMRVLVSYFVGIARAHDCTELRLEGRDWSRIFPDWERLDERPGRNELRKAL